jgi:hypothetical protein
LRAFNEVVEGQKRIRAEVVEGRERMRAEIVEGQERIRAENRANFASVDEKNTELTAGLEQVRELAAGLATAVGEVGVSVGQIPRHQGTISALSFPLYFSHISFSR